MKLESKRDDELITLWQDGNELAYKELFNRYFNKLYKFILKSTHDTILSEELVMDVMLCIWQKKEILRSDMPVSCYLYKCIKNKLIDHFRKRVIATVSLEKSPIICQYSAFKADSLVLHKEYAQIYNLGIDSLPPQKKKIFKLSREEGFTYEQIADKLQLSKNTVENHMVVALRMLRSCMNFN